MNSTPNRTPQDNTPWWASVGVAALLGVVWFSFHLRFDLPNDVNEVVRHAALSRELLLSEPWRVVTASLLHIGSGHLLLNLILAVTFGHTLAVLTRIQWTWSIFFVSGWVGSVVAACIHEGWLLGASASVFGLLGAITISLSQTGKPAARGQALFVGALGILLSIVGSGNSTAHLAGFGMGACLTTLPPKYRTLVQRTTWLCLLAGLVSLAYCRAN